MCLFISTRDCYVVCCVTRYLQVIIVKCSLRKSIPAFKIIAGKDVFTE